MSMEGIWETALKVNCPRAFLLLSDITLLLGVVRPRVGKGRLWHQAHFNTSLLQLLGFIMLHKHMRNFVRWWTFTPPTPRPGWSGPMAKMMSSVASWCIGCVGTSIPSSARPSGFRATRIEVFLEMLQIRQNGFLGCCVLRCSGEIASASSASSLNGTPPNSTKSLSSNSGCFGAASPAPSAPRGTELDSASTG